MAEGDGWLSDKYFIIGSVALGVVSVQVLVIGGYHGLTNEHEVDDTS